MGKLEEESRIYGLAQLYLVCYQFVSMEPYFETETSIRHVVVANGVMNC